MREIGTVVSATGETAQVEIEQHSACKSCNGCSNTGQGTMIATTTNLVGAVPGDKVILTIPESRILKAAAVVYVVPLAALIVGIIAGAALAPVFSVSEAASGIIGGAIAMGLSILGVSRYDRSAGEQNSYSFSIELLGGNETNASQ